MRNHDCLICDAFDECRCEPANPARTIPRPLCLVCEGMGEVYCADVNGKLHVTIVQLVPLSSVGQLAALGSDGRLYYTDITATSNSRAEFCGVSRIPWQCIPVRIPGNLGSVGES